MAERLSKKMLQVIMFASNPDAYIRELRGNLYEVSGSTHRAMGIPLNPRLSRATVNALLARGKIVFGKRIRHQVQQVGYFLKPLAEGPYTLDAQTAGGVVNKEGSSE